MPARESRKFEIRDPARISKVSTWPSVCGLCSSRGCVVETWGRPPVRLSDRVFAVWGRTVRLRGNFQFHSFTEVGAYVLP